MGSFGSHALNIVRKEFGLMPLLFLPPFHRPCLHSLSLLGVQKWSWPERFLLANMDTQPSLEELYAMQLESIHVLSCHA